jgi:hypothetical protein
MAPALLADLVLVLHLGFIVFALFGAALLPRRPRLVWLHAPALAWGVWIEASGGICPLTPLENHFRRLAGEAGYGGGFIERYLLPLIYPDGLTPAVQWVLAGVLLAVNAALYARWWRHARAARRATPLP